VMSGIVLLPACPNDFEKNREPMTPGCSSFL
jgi:hypothetical protein